MSTLLQINFTDISIPAISAIEITTNVAYVYMQGGEIPPDYVTNPMMADMSPFTIKGNGTANIDNPQDLTATQVTGMLNTFTRSAKGLVPLSGDGSNTRFLCEDGTFSIPASGGGTVHYAGVVTVGKSGCDFTDPYDAHESITDATENNRYVIIIYPGVYNIRQINAKSYVDWTSLGINSVVLKPDGNHHIFNFTQPMVEVSFLSLQSAPNDYHAINVESCGDFVQFHKISIYDSFHPVKIRTTTAISNAYFEYVDISGNYEIGIDISTSGSTNAAFLNLENFYLIPETDSIQQGILASGANTTIVIPLASFQGYATTGEGISIRDGALVKVSALVIDNFDIGIRVPNIGSASRIQLENVIFDENNNMDLVIEHLGTTGSFSGTGDRNKISIPDEVVLSMAYNDYDGGKKIIGSFFLGQKHSEITDVTKLITDGSTMGLIEGGQLSVFSGLTISVNAGFGYCQNDASSYAPKISWLTQTLGLPSNTNVYIYFTNTGVITYNTVLPNFIKNIILGRVRTNTDSIVYIDETPFRAEHAANYLNRLNRLAIGALFGTGCTISENVTAGKININPGVYYVSQNDFEPTGGNAVQLLQHYHSSGSWTYALSDTIPNDHYDNGTDLVNVTTSWYTKHSIYIMGEGALEKRFLVYSNAQYETQLEAEEATLPIPPTDFKDGVVIIGSIVRQQGNSSIIKILDNRPRIGFTPQGTSTSDSHNNLLDKQGGTEGEWYHLTQAQNALAAQLSALTPSNDDIIQRKTGVWTNRTIAQYKADLALNNVTNNAQVKKITSSTDNDLIAWDGATGDLPKNSGIQTSAVSGAITNSHTHANKAALDNVSGTNTGDQTSIVGISGTKSQFDTACSDGNFLYVGDVTNYTHPNHTGHVTSVNDGAQTIANNVITDAMVVTANKDGLAGTASMRTLGTGAQQACAGNDSRLSDARTPTAHVHAGADINSGTIDGDRLPAMSTTKQGAVPATGTPALKYLRDDGTWATVTASLPEVITGLNVPTENQTITTGKWGICSRFYEISNGLVLDIYENASFEIT